MKVKTLNLNFQTLIYLSSLIFLISGLTGCETLAKKFTRKPKKQQEVEMVLIPQDYASRFSSKEEEYRYYFMVWESWQDELINALLYQKSHKKQLGCLDQAVKNLIQIKSLLSFEKQKELDPYIKRMNSLGSEISKDRYSIRTVHHRSKAERIKRLVSKSYPYAKVKDYLK
jgi:hypothetical protein